MILTSPTRVLSKWRLHWRSDIVDDTYWHFNGLLVSIVINELSKSSKLLLWVNSKKRVRLYIFLMFLLWKSTNREYNFFFWMITSCTCYDNMIWTNNLFGCQKKGNSVLLIFPLVIIKFNRLTNCLNEKAKGKLFNSSF